MQRPSLFDVVLHCLHVAKTYFPFNIIYLTIEVSHVAKFITVSLSL